jgi:hypothetical protein
LFALLATLHDSPYDTYWHIRGFCPDPQATTDISSFQANGINGDAPRNQLIDQSRTLMGSCDFSMGTFYVAALTWAILVVTGTGGTDEYPSNLSTAENIFICVFNRESRR